MFYFHHHYPIPLTERISFDAKLKFVREHIDPDKVDTMIIGSSIGLNDLLGTELEKDSQKVKYAVNMSVYGATTLQAEQLMELRKTFPNLKRILYSVQYSDTPHNWKFKNYKPKKLIRYMRQEQNLIEYFFTVIDACSNIPFCYKRSQSWEHDHMHKNIFESLLFDASGSVPLYIYGKDVIGHRWRLAQPNIMSGNSFKAIKKMAQTAKDAGVEYYVVHQPYRKELYAKHDFVRAAIAKFDELALEALKNSCGHLIKTQHLGLHGNKYFADRTHLNVDGSKVVSEYIAKQIDKIEK